MSYAASLEQFSKAVRSGAESVAIYTHNYLGGHARVLQANYPTVRITLGDSAFAAIARVYTWHYPPVHWDINLYGEDFAQLLAAQVQGGKANAFDWPLLATTARVEYAITQAYYADDNLDNSAKPIVIAAVAAVTAPDSSSELQPNYPFADIACPLLLGSDVFVWRDDLRVRVENLPPLAGH